MIARAVSPAERREFIARHTAVATPPLVPEIRLYLATEVTPLWEATEVTLEQVGLPPPFWAFAWPGGRALARYLLDHRDLVAGRRVLDFAAGSGISAIAAARCGATVLATEIDPFAIEAMALNAELNGVAFDFTETDVAGQDDAWDVVVAGDICYERPTAERVSTWLRSLTARGALVLMGDPGRMYVPPAEWVEERATYVVPTSRDLEEQESRRTAVWAFRPAPGGRLL